MSAMSTCMLYLLTNVLSGFLQRTYLLLLLDLNIACILISSGVSVLCLSHLMFLLTGKLRTRKYDCFYSQFSCKEDEPENLLIKTVWSLFKSNKKTGFLKESKEQH